MACSLAHHSRSYRLSCMEALKSPAISPFACRHLDLANHPKATAGQRWGHRVIAAIEFIPVIGLFASLIERIIAVFLYSHRGQVVQKQSCDPIQGKQAASLNLPQAIPQATIHSHSSQPSVMQIASRIRISQAAAKAAEERKAALILIDFCEKVFSKLRTPSADVDALLKRLSPLNILEKAKGFRDWLSNPQSTEDIENIDLPNANLVAIPPEISLFRKLLTLDLRNNRLTSLPPEIWRLNELTDLDLENNALTSLPQGIDNLKNVKIIYLSGNLLTSLPDEIGSLRKLEFLLLINNHLTTLPLSIGSLKKLKALNMQGNAFTSLPSSISRLPSPCKITISPVSFTMPTHGNIAIV